MHKFALPLSVVLLASCSGGKAPPAPVEPETPAAWADVEQSVVSALDTSVDPCTDFYQYACGGWMDSYELPSDKVRFTRSFSSIAERNEELVKGILEELDATAGDDANAQRLAKYYGSCLNTEAIDAAGVAPIEPFLAAVDGVKDMDSMMSVTGQQVKSGLDAWFGFYIGADDKNPTQNAFHMFQGSFNLGPRDYYLEDGEKFQTQREQYVAHINKMLALSGVIEPLGEDADVSVSPGAKVLAFETALAQMSWDRVSMRDADATYNKVSMDEFKAASPSLPWDAYFGQMSELEGLDEMIVGTPSFFTDLSTWMDGGDVRWYMTRAEVTPDSEGQLVETAFDWDTARLYMKWTLINSTASHLSSELHEADFAFYGKTLRGQQEMEPRWKICTNRTSGTMGELIGQEYVKRAFAGDSKVIAEEMVSYLMKSFEASLPELAWMDDATREKALGKAKKIATKIGYPDEWTDYSTLETKSDDYFGNVMASRAFGYREVMDKFGQPVDKSEWFMPPQMVNAYYNPSGNEIAFPAGILQAPFFDASFPKAMNYGAIGMVIGHEITHGFDDNGRKFTGDGMLQEWWAPEVASRFEERAACVEEQYSAMEVLPETFVNGKLTLGENIADQGGLKQAYRAYKMWSAENGGEPGLAGLTSDQLFYVAFAQGWCTETTDEYLLNQVKGDPHSPAKPRVNGPVRNDSKFWEAFSCEEGTPMHPAADEVCEVW